MRTKRTTQPQYKARRARVCTLAEALAYRNTAIVDRFVKEQEVTRREALALFRDAKKWLWLLARSRVVEGAPKHLAIFSGMEMLDEMWHTFILFTADYTRFCEERFGSFIHHQPTSEAEHRRTRVQLEKDPQRFAAQREAALRAQITFTYDELGARTAKRWYDEIPRLYSARFKSSTEAETNAGAA